MLLLVITIFSLVTILSMSGAKSAAKKGFFASPVPEKENVTGHHAPEAANKNEKMYVLPPKIEEQKPSHEQAASSHGPSHETHAHTAHDHGAAHASHGNDAHGHGAHGHGKGPHGMDLDHEVMNADRNLSSSVAMRKDPSTMKYSAAEIEAFKAQYRKDPPMSKRFVAGIKNIPNYIRNAFDNTVGYAIANYQNYKGLKELRKHPEKQVVWHMAGAKQNIGGQWYSVHDYNKHDQIGLHVRSAHNLVDKENAEQAYGQMKQLYSKGGIDNPSERDDIFQGHSSGGNVASYMFKDPKAKEHGVKSVNGIASTGLAITPRHLSQRALFALHNADGERADKPEGQQRATEQLQGKPVMRGYFVGGEFDSLVPPEETYTPGATRQDVYTGYNSMHFASAGANRKAVRDINAHFREVRKESQIKQDPEMYKHHRAEYDHAQRPAA